MTERQDEALQRLNQGIQESRQTVQQQTMELAQSYFVDSAEALKDRIKENRSTLEGLPDQIPGGREEAFQALFQELMDNYSNIESCLDEAQQRVSELDTDRIRRQGEVEATDAARREAKELGVDLTEIEGTGADGRIIVPDVIEAAQAMQEEAGEEEPEASSGNGTAEEAAQGAQGAQDAVGQAAQQAQDAAGQATDQAGQAVQRVQGTFGELVGGEEGGDQQGGGGPLGGVTDQVGQAAQTAQGVAGQATDQAQQAAGQTTDQAGQVAGQAADQVPGGDGAEGPRATRAARRRAEELGLDLSEVQGTGAGGLITLRDVTNS